MYTVTILGPNGFRDEIVTNDPGGAVRLQPGEHIISSDVAGGVPAWNRADISQAQFMRVRAIAMKFAGFLENVRHADIRADVRELREILKGEGNGNQGMDTPA